MINFDDHYGPPDPLARRRTRCVTDSSTGADLRGSSLEMNFDGLRFTVEYGGERVAADVAAGRQI